MLRRFAPEERVDVHDAKGVHTVDSLGQVDAVGKGVRLAHTLR